MSRRMRVSSRLAARFSLEAALALADLRAGRGDLPQREAFQEYEWRRCCASAVYWLENYGWIVDGGRITKWELWPIQRWVLEDLQAHRSIVGVKARQLGITTTVGHFALWDALFHDATTWDNISANEDKAKDILKRVQATKDRLPAWMVERAQNRNTREGEVGKRADKADATTRIAFGLSEMKIATSTIRAFQGASSNMNVDEATLHLDLKRKLQQMQATLDGSGGVGSVIANGNGQDDFYYFYRQACAGTNGFKPYFFYWGDDPSRLDGWLITLEDGSTALAADIPRDEVLLKYAMEQRDNCPWYSSMRKKFLFENKEADDWAFRAVYPTNEDEAFFLGGNSLFALAKVNALNTWARTKGKTPVIGMLEPRGDSFEFQPHPTRGRFYLYEPPVSGEKYVVTADPSGGGADGDYSDLRVSKLLNSASCGEDACIYHGKVDPALLALHAFRLATWYNKARICPERNNHGGLFIDKLKEWGYSNFYLQKEERYFTDEDKEIIGYYAGAVSKAKLIDGISEVIHNTFDWIEGREPQGAYYVIHDVETVRQLSRYELKDNGKMGAPKGDNDDAVITLGLAVIALKDITQKQSQQSYYPNPMDW